VTKPPKPFSKASGRLAEEITGRSIRAMQDAGLGPVEIGHSLIHAGIDWLPAACCAKCLEGEYRAAIEAIEDRTDKIPSMRPGIDIAANPRCLH
jgi:hypothetical protein